MIKHKLTYMSLEGEVEIVSADFALLARYARDRMLSNYKIEPIDYQDNIIQYFDKEAA